jgi:CRP-like cAMP-binding protein
MPMKTGHTGNRLFKLLPRGIEAEAVSLRYGDVIYEAGKPSRDVYFPSDCVVSVFAVTDRKSGLGVNLVGNEGLVGTGLVLLGDSAMYSRMIIQSPGTAIRVSVEKIRDVLRGDPALQWEFFRYAYVVMLQARKIAVCSNFHETGPRLARWLLSTQDRSGSGDFYLTQKYLAEMLGVRRVSVTQAASALQRNGFITYSRGRVKILDAGGLEQAACPCYAAIKNLERGMLDSPV